MSNHVGRGEVTSPLQRDAIPIVIFLALTCVMTNPLVLHFANAVEDKQDALLNTWIVAWVGHALITTPLDLFNANIFYPYPNTLAYSETMLPQGLFALPFNLAFDNTVIGYNLVLLASFFLAAYSMYLFVFDLTRNRGAGIVAGTIFAFNPYNLGNLAQVQLLSFGWMPLALLFLRRLLNSDRRPLTIDRPLRFEIWDLRFRICFLFALFFSLQALSSFYYAFLAGFAVVLYIAWFFITHHGVRITHYVLRFTQLAISFLLIAIFVIPFFLPYLQVQREMGFERQVTESEPFSASLKLFTEVSSQNVLYGNLLAPRPPVMLGGYPLDNLFPGIIAVALVIVGVIVSRNRAKWFYFVLLTFAFLLSLGPRLFLTPTVGTEITLPYRWLYDIFPLMKALRAPVRFDALVMLALAVLAGLGMQKTTSSKPKVAVGFLVTAHRLLPSAIVTLIALEYLALPAARITPVPVWNEIPEYVRWLQQQPPDVILELPMIASDPTKSLDLTTQYLSTYHWHTTPDGYSGFNPPRRGEIAYEMQIFPDERSIALLRALNVQYVISHNTPARNWETPPVDFQIVQRFDPTRVYRIVPAPSFVPVIDVRVFYPQPAALNQNYTAFVIIENRTQQSFAIKPTDKLQVQARWSDDTTQNVESQMPLVTSTISIVPVRLTTPSHTGNLRLDLSIRGTTIGEWNWSGDVTVQTGEPPDQVVLPIRVELGSPLQTTFSPGNSVKVNLLWLALNKIDAYYSASVRVVDARGNKILNVDRQPATPTLLWTPKYSIADDFTLELPRDLAPGEYSIEVMMYQADQGIEALILDRQLEPREKIELGKFIVK